MADDDNNDEEPNEFIEGINQHLGEILEQFNHASRQAHAEHVEMHVREANVRQHEWATAIREFIDGLEQKQLKVLQDTLMNIANQPDPRASAMYYLGIVHSVLWMKFDNVDALLEGIQQDEGGEGDAQTSE